MAGQITGLDLTEAARTAAAYGVAESEALVECLTALEAGALVGIDKSRPPE
ncbi:hypothetical protein [Caulobacter sp. 1776]|uniref:hypothetical protein n=1 Tax=Caulobacter sp. 1776 TaxID=3156420 RepID=UPI0033979D5A